MNHINHIHLRILAAAFLLLASIPYGAFATDETRNVVRDAKGNVVTTSAFGNCVRTKWDIGSDPCAPAKPMKQARSLTREERTVYFDFNHAEIPPREYGKLDSLASVLRSDAQVRSGHIVGFADRLGSVSYNKKLSERRAKNVEDYLHTHGYLHTSLAHVRWLGKSGSVTHCPNTLPRADLIACLQKDRRVEVEIDYYPATSTPPSP